MKKLFTVATIALLAIVNAYAGGPYKFEKDAEGEYSLSGEFKIDCPADLAWKRLNSYLQSTFTTETNEVTVDEATKTAKITGCKENSKYIYNPFAGTFKDTIHYELILSIEGDSVKYTYNNLVMESYAAGFVNYDKKESMRLFLRSYQKALDKAEDKSLTAKERKSALSDVKDYESSLDKAQETLMKRIDDIQFNVE